MWFSSLFRLLCSSCCRVVEKGIRNIVVITAGFKEIGGEGAEREQNFKSLFSNTIFVLLVQTVWELSIQISKWMRHLRKECLHGKCESYFQSGAMAVAIIDWAYENWIGFSKIISMGNKAVSHGNRTPRTSRFWRKYEGYSLYLKVSLTVNNFLKLLVPVSLKPIIAIKSGTRSGNKSYFFLILVRWQFRYRRFYGVRSSRNYSSKYRRRIVRLRKDFSYQHPQREIESELLPMLVVLALWQRMRLRRQIFSWFLSEETQKN